MVLKKEDPTGRGTGRASLPIPLSVSGFGDGAGNSFDVGRGRRGFKAAARPATYCCATGATSGVMRRMVTRRFSRLAACVLTFRYSSP